MYLSPVYLTDPTPHLFPLVQILVSSTRYHPCPVAPYAYANKNFFWQQYFSLQCDAAFKSQKIGGLYSHSKLSGSAQKYLLSHPYNIVNMMI